MNGFGKIIFYVFSVFDFFGLEFGFYPVSVQSEL